MPRDPIVEDCDNMENILVRMGVHRDLEIWQNEFIYQIAKNLYDIDQLILKGKIKIEKGEN